MEPKTIATNKKAFRDYNLEATWECGIALKGGEVKSLRSGDVNFTDSFALVEGGEVFLYNLHIAPYAQASYLNLEPDRKRKLLLHQKEIEKIYGLTTQKKLYLIPTRIYFNKRGLAKVAIALGRPKKLYDRREDIKKRDVEKELKRTVKSYKSKT